MKILLKYYRLPWVCFAAAVAVSVASTRENVFFCRQWKQINQLEHDLLTDAWKFHLEKNVTLQKEEACEETKVLCGTKSILSLGIITPD